MSCKIVALVTGGVRGIGLEIAKGIAKRGTTTVITSREKLKGDNLADKLQQEGLDIFHHALDITQKDSIAELLAWIQQKFGGLDILINNAAVFSGCMPELLNLNRAKWSIKVNYYGTRSMVEAFLPIMRPGARIINVSSVGGRFDALNNNWADKLLDTENLTLDTIDSFIQEYLEALGKGELERYGFQANDASDYSISKMAVNAYTRLLAKLLKNRVCVNALCPGLNATEMSFNIGQPPEVGADTAIWLALLPSSESPSGKFFVCRQEISNLREIPLVCNDTWYRTNEEIGQALMPLALAKQELLRRHNMSLT